MNVSQVVVSVTSDRGASAWLQYVPPMPVSFDTTTPKTLSTGVNAIHLSMHADVRVDEWLLYHHHATFAGDGMTHSDCGVFTEDGRLVASFSVESMVRGFADPSKAADSRTAM